MNKNSFRKLIAWLPVLVSAVGLFSSHILHITLVTLPTDASFHFNLVTINSLFGGFLFTSYSLMVGLLDNKIVQKLKSTDIIKRRNSHILRGIVCSVLSVCSSLIFILFPPAGSKLSDFFKCALCNVEITFMFFGIGYFLLSMKEMSSLVSAMYGNNKYSPEVLSEIDCTLDKNKEDA